MPMRDQFLIRPDVVFLNHGSFGACPRPVFEAYQAWQLELERQPVEFLGRRHDTLLNAARERLAGYLNADSANLSFITNATGGVNIVARSLSLSPGDEILATNHEYGACDSTWQFVCMETGAHYIRQPIPLPVTTPAEMLDLFWSAVTPRTRVLYISHITSPTALTFPVAALCARARAAGILTVIDGAHAPGQIPVNLRAIDPDFYSGNLHKWLCAPKGTAFLYARPEHQYSLRPPVISWGWSPDAAFVDKMQMQGTRDISSFLSVPAAIDFQAANQWETLRRECTALVQETRNRINALTGLESICPDGPGWYTQMAAVRLPPNTDTALLKTRLYEEYCIEIPVYVWNDQPLIRVSIQAYNTRADVDALVDALKVLL